MRLASIPLVLATAVALPSVYRDEHYSVVITSDVPYAPTLVDCAVLTDPSTCATADMLLDVYQPENVSSAELLPVVMSVHGGGYTGGMGYGSWPVAHE